jgi:hypothetical protein
MAWWIAGSLFMAAGSLLVGYSLGLRTGERRTNLAKDLRLSAQEQRIARLEKALTTKPGAAQTEIRTDAGQ